MVDLGVINTYYVEKGRTSYLMEAFPPESCASYRLNQKYIYHSNVNKSSNSIKSAKIEIFDFVFETKKN